MDCLVLKRPWVGVLVFFCIAMVPSELGGSFIANMRFQPQALMLVQVTVIKGNILQTMVEKAMKNGDNSKDSCSLPPETGTCRARKFRFYYNPASNECENFIYGGCHGNANNFKTQDECRLTCVVSAVRRPTSGGATA